MYWQIAIDGPAGAGKSTIAKEVAKALHCEYLDTGAMYRAVTLKALNLKINMENESEYSFLATTVINFHEGKIYLDGLDVSENIRSLEVSNNVSLASSFKSVREQMVALQQNLVRSMNIIMDGRDIGTVVLPKAHLKIFLTANVEERARRRMKERMAAGKECFSLEETIREIQERDYKDSNREISPLAKATDAIEIDTSNQSVSEVVNTIISLVMERGYKMENIKTEKEMNVETNTVEEKAAEETVAPEAPVAVEAVAETVAPEAPVAVEASPVEQEATPVQATDAASEIENPLKELQLVEGTIVKIEKAVGEIVRQGKVVRPAKQERVLVRFENGQEGLLLRKDMINVGDDEDLADVFMEDEKIQVVVKKVFPDGGKVLLSTALVQKRENIKKFEEVIANHGVFMAKVLKGIKVGLILEYDGYPCLLPTSQVNVKPEEYDTLIGTELLVAPIRVDYNRIRLLVSSTVANAIQYRAEKHEFVNTIKVGDVFDGVVKNIESYGAFVEIGKGVEGLLHISEVEHNRIVKVEKVLNVGDQVKVQVIKMDGDHIGLSRKSLLPNFWKDFIDAKKVDDVVNATITEINKAGVVLQLQENVQGFLPRSEFSWERDAYIEDYAKVGDTLDVKIIELDLSKKRIILSRKQLIENPWQAVRVKSGDTILVTIEKTLAEGVKVSYNGASGFLPKGNIVPGTDLIEGAQVEMIVKVFDPERTRLLVTMKEENHFDKNQINRYLKSQEKVSNTLGDYFDEQFKTNRKKGK